MLGLNLIEEEKNSELGFTEELQNFIDEENRNLAVVSTIDEANYTIRRIKELQEQKEHDIAIAGSTFDKLNRFFTGFFETRLNIRF